MTHFVLVHGAWHGSWCWERVAPLLQAAGYTVDAPDLPGMGDDQTPFADDTMQQWLDFLTERVESVPVPVILAGHNRGGVLISQVAERIPERIRRLVYVTAFLLTDGESLTENVQQMGDGAGAPTDVDETSATCSVPPEQRVPTFYNQCANDVAAKAARRMCPEPLQPLSAPVSLSDGRFGAVPRAYVEAAHDAVLTLPWQRAMQERLPCDPVITLPSDHSPFYSSPAQLAEALIIIASHS